MREHNYTALLTGHHKDDQAETVFMKILRGARLFDIKGIKEKQPFANGELIRPLLKVTKRSCHVWNTSKMSLISKTII